MQRLPKLLLVFLSVIFLGLKTSLSIIAFYVAVIIRDPGEVFFRTFWSILLEVILPLVAEVPELEFLCLYFFFQNLFLNFFQAFLEVFVLLEILQRTEPKVFTIC